MLVVRRVPTPRPVMGPTPRSGTRRAPRASLPDRSDRVTADRGQSAVVGLAVVAAALVIVAVALAGVGTTVVDRGRAQTAADAAALASVDGTAADAHRLAGMHGAVVVAWERRPTVGGVVVMVTVRLGDAEATARATDAP